MLIRFTLSRRYCRFTTLPEKGLVSPTLTKLMSALNSWTVNHTPALLSSLRPENIEKIFEFFKEPKNDLNLGFGDHLGRFQSACPARLYLKAVGANEASVLLEVKGVFDGAELPDPSTRLEGFEETRDNWFVTVWRPKRLDPPIPIQGFKDYKTKEAIRNDFQGIRQVNDPDPN